MSEMFPIAWVSERERASCRSKTRYAKKKTARSVINEILRGHRGHGRAADLRTYCCPVCHGWHLTKDVEGPNRDNRRAVAFQRLVHRYEVRRRRELFAARHPLDDFSTGRIDFLLA